MVLELQQLRREKKRKGKTSRWYDREACEVRTYVSLALLWMKERRCTAC
jgi:stalled ribosome alternative rescue factor ArfA